MGDINLFAVFFSGYTSVSANDGKWHHICYAWANSAGSWKLCKDGKVADSGKNFKTGKVVYSQQAESKHLSPECLKTGLVA